METNITLGKYFSNEYGKYNECDDIENYVWYYKIRYFFNPCSKKIRLGYDNDKIGISQNGKYMMHDNIVWELVFFRKYEDTEKDGEKFLYLIYKITNGTDIIMRRKDTLLYFKYKKRQDGKQSFMAIGFNNSEFKLLNTN